MYKESTVYLLALFAIFNNVKGLPIVSSNASLDSGFCLIEMLTQEEQLKHQ